MTEHPENGTGSHCGNCRNRLFTALRLWHWREPADKLTARSQPAARSAPLQTSPRWGGNSKRRQNLHTPNPHTHSQAYQVQARALREGGRNAFAAFHYNPQA